MQPPVYRFGDFEVDEGRLELRRSGTSVFIQPKPFLVICYLIRHRDRIVSGHELMSEVWKSGVVSGASLSTALHEARRALDDNDPERPLLLTLRNRGYRFMGSVESTTATVPAKAAPRPEPRAVSRATSAQQSAFMDRDREMGELREALASARSGERRIVLVQGPPGIGKTRTASELAREAADAGFEIHTGRAYESGGAPSFWPWIQVLRSICEARPGPELAAAAGLAAPDLAQLVPELRAQLGEPASGTELAPEQARFRMFDGLTGFIRNVARRAPLLVVLEDLHWADEASLALLVFLARSTNEAPLAIVGTHRPVIGSEPACARALGRVLREPGTASITLVGLEPRSVARILTQTLGCSPPPALLERVLAITGGNPLFVAELARLLVALGIEALQGTQTLPIPDRLRDTVRIRTAECSPPCQALLRASSVIGPRFAVPLLKRVMGLRGAEVVAALAEAERRDLVQPDPGPGSYRFAHELVRESLYQELDDGERSRLHRSIGDAIEELSASSPTPPLAELAHHFAQAATLDRVDRAIHYARRAAARARAVFAHQEEADHCRRALAALNLLDAPDASLRCELGVELTEALAAADAPIELVQRTAEDVMQQARALGDAALLTRCVLVHCRYSLDKDTVAFFDSARASPLVERLAGLIQESLVALGDGDRHRDLQVSSLALLARLHSNTGDLVRAAALVEQAAARSTREDAAQQCAIQGVRFEASSCLEQPAECMAIADRIVDYAQRAGLPAAEAYGHVGSVTLHLQACDRDGADASGAQIERLAREHTIADIFILRALWRGLVAQMEGRLDDAEREAREVLQLSRRLNYGSERTAALVGPVLWWVSLLRGRPMTMLSQLQDYTRTQPNLLFPRFLLARLYAELGHRADASAQLQRLDASVLAKLPRDHQWLFTACLSAEVCALVGDSARAGPLYELLHGHAEQAATMAFIGACIGSTARPLGSLAALLGMWRECEELFDLALESNEALRAPTLVAWTRMEYARVLRRHSHPRKRRKGDEMFELAVRLVAPLGMSDALARAYRA